MTNETPNQRRKREAAERRQRAKEADRIEDEVRRRLAQAMSSAGVGSDRIAIEVLYLLPKDFVDAYQTLFLKALQAPGAVSAGDADAIQVKRTHRDQKPLARHQKTHKGFWLIRDENALKQKGRIDRDLRRLARKSRSMPGQGEPEKRCGGCGKFQEKGWIYCPYCAWEH